MSRANPLGSTPHPRRPAEAGPDGLAGDGFEVRLEYTFPATCSPTSLPSSRTTRLTASSSAAPANLGPPATAWRWPARAASSSSGGSLSWTPPPIFCGSLAELNAAAVTNLPDRPCLESW